MYSHSQGINDEKKNRKLPVFHSQRAQIHLHFEYGNERLTLQCLEMNKLYFVFNIFYLVLLFALSLSLSLSFVHNKRTHVCFRLLFLFFHVLLFLSLFRLFSVHCCRIANHSSDKRHLFTNK